MKSRWFALILILALSLVGWAQETPATSAAPNSTPAPQAQGCCHHNMANMKDGKGCCHHAAADAKGATACCGEDKCEAKDGKSCCEGKDMKAAMAQCKKNDCCKDGKCCGDGKSCGDAKGAKTAMDCCGSKCERQPQTPTAS
jgi:hypothetical protein